MNNLPEDFETLEVCSDDNLVMVSLEWIGEGLSGDYDSKDPDDIPLLRFNLYRKFTEGDDEQKIINLCESDTYVDGDWMAVQDGSYCVQLSALDEHNHLYCAAKFILNQVESGIRNWKREKTLYQKLSWVKILDGIPVI